MIYVFLAHGFEEIEAVASIDVLRRADLQVKIAGVGGKTIEGAHGIILQCDADIEKLSPESGFDAIVLPGGMPGTLNLEKSPAVHRWIDLAVSSGAYIAAICAAPSILGHKGLLNGKKAVCFPGFEQELEGAEISINSVCTDGKIITAKGAGTAINFALEIISRLCGQEKSEKIRDSLQCMKV